MWTTNLPTEPGLYALIEPITSAGVNGRGIVDVERHHTNVLIYGGFRPVKDAPEGTIWHRLADLPLQLNSIDSE